MDRNFISSPNDFQHMDGVESMDFEHTFALDGTGNDETLRLYLRKAGLSDEIGYLTPDQRRAFIYDIIKSNKIPGYWMPSTMTTPTPYNLPLPNSKPPNTITPLHVRSVPVTPVMQRQADPALKYATISTYSSNSSVQSLEQSSPIVPRRYEPEPPTPPSPSTFVTSVKGSKYEISGPMNFQHMAGDMTRDRTRNAFDLSLTTNDNVLRKYMMEHGIKEDDLSGMRKQDVIKNIVQSHFTWMPPKRNVNASNSQPSSSSTQNERTPTSTSRVSRSRKTMQVPPPPPPIKVVAPVFTKDVSSTSVSPSLTTSSSAKTLAATQSSLSFLSGRFADPTEFPSIEDIYSNKTMVEAESVESLTQSRLTYRKPAPTLPIRTHKIVDATPPPPSLVKASNNSTASVIYHSNQSIESLDELAVSESVADENVYARTIIGRSEALPEPEITISTNENIYSTIKPVNTIDREVEPTIGNGLYAHIGKGKKSVRPTPPPTPPKPALKSQLITSASVIPPPPPPSTHVPPSAEMVSVDVIASDVTPSPPPPPPLPPSIGPSGIPLPPPPPPIGISGIPLPPPPPMPNSIARSHYEPAPATFLNVNDTPPKAQTSVQNSGDDRGAFLDSIRKGVTLKKVDQKGATVDVKPRAEHKPKTNDFLSELKMGITLRRVKNKDHNLCAGEDPEESQA